MQSLICAGVQPVLQVVSPRRRIGARLDARSTAWYSGSPEVLPPGPWLLVSPVTVPSVGAGCPLGPITFGSQS